MRALPIFFLLAAACAPEAIPGTQVSMRWQRDASLYDAPFPSEDLRKTDGAIDLRAFPNPDSVSLVAQSIETLSRDARGFATSGAIYFRLSAAIDPARLPSLAASTTSRANVFLMDVDERSPQRVAPVRAAEGGAAPAERARTPRSPRHDRRRHHGHRSHRGHDRADAVPPPRARHG